MKTVIFDFDGTIADSFGAVVKIAHHLTKHPRLKDPNEVNILREHSLADIAQEVKIPKYKWPYLLFRGRSLMEKQIKFIKPFPGVETSIKELSKSGYNLYLMSSNSEKNIKLFLQSHNMSNCFLKIYAGVGLLGKDQALRKILRKNNLNSNNCIYIGDEPRDIEAARANNMDCLSVSWGFNTANLLIKHDPFNLIDSPSDIVKAINNWNLKK
jgi:phosphoglycolate phosphatase-like HAD superfamily hydrolase